MNFVGTITLPTKSGTLPKVPCKEKVSKNEGKSLSETSCLTPVYKISLGVFLRDLCKNSLSVWQACWPIPSTVHLPSIAISQFGVALCFSLPLEFCYKKSCQRHILLNATVTSTIPQYMQGNLWNQKINAHPISTFSGPTYKCHLPDPSRWPNYIAKMNCFNPIDRKGKLWRPGCLQKHPLILDYKIETLQFQWNPSMRQTCRLLNGKQGKSRKHWMNWIRLCNPGGRKLTPTSF